jgi:hypothetical protein
MLAKHGGHVDLLLGMVNAMEAPRERHRYVEQVTGSGDHAIRPDAMNGNQAIAIADDPPRSKGSLT